MVKTRGQPDSLLGWMGSLADPTRLRLVRLLERNELGVVELCDVLQLPQSTVSRHLKVLSDQKWVRSRRHGTIHYYRTILDELDPPARRLWILAREQTDSWATVAQDQLRLDRRLRQKETDSESFFAGAAAEWDKLRGELYGQSFSASAIMALLPPGYVVADLGCGTGPIAAQIAPFVRQVIGVDNSAAMLKAARRRMVDQDSIDLRRGDLTAVPIDTGSCDAALLVLALTYVMQPGIVLSEMSRILKPAGRAVIVDLLPHDNDDFRRRMGQIHQGFSPAEIESLLASAGFSQVAIRNLPPEPQAKGPALFLAVGQKTQDTKQAETKTSQN